MKPQVTEQGRAAQDTVLVIGSTGQLACSLARQGTAARYAVVCRGRPDCDVTDLAALRRLFEEISPAAVINAAAYTAVDNAESDPATAFAVNANGPGHLAALCAEHDIALVHISTDYVFDGTGRRAYLETDSIAPLGVYGASKAAGEAAIRRTWARHLIFRTAWLYGADGHNFLKTMLRLGSERDELSVVDDQRGTPTSADDAAGAILAALDRMLAAPADDPLWGTYHLTNGGSTTWCGFAREIFRLAAASGRRTPKVTPIPTAAYPTPARRPAYSVLDTSKVRNAFGIELPPWQASLAACYARTAVTTGRRRATPGTEEKVA